MIHSLTSVQLNLLHRCDGGLRVWEVDRKLEALLAELLVLLQLDLVTFDEARGYELTAQGESCLLRLRA